MPTGVHQVEEHSACELLIWCHCRSLQSVSNLLKSYVLLKVVSLCPQKLYSDEAKVDGNTELTDSYQFPGRQLKFGMIQMYSHL